MACSCNRNNRRGNNFGCRRNIQNNRWPTSCGGYTGYASTSSGCYAGGNSCYGSGACSNSGSCWQNGCGQGNSCNHRPCGCGTYSGNSCSGSCSGSCGNAVPYRPGGGCGPRPPRPPRPPYGCEDDCYPFYCGPCGPVNPVCGCGCGCESDPCANDCTQIPCGCGIYGSFQQNGSLVLDEGGAIPFSGSSTANGISQEDGELTLLEAGVYMVTLNASIPANTTLFTQLTIRHNGNTVSGGTLTINKTIATSPLMASAQVIVTACAGDRITVNTSQALNLTTETAGEQIAALTILRIA